MENIGIDFKDRRLIHKLCVNEKVVIKGKNEAYEEAEINKYARQRCNLSHLLH